MLSKSTLFGQEDRMSRSEHIQLESLDILVSTPESRSALRIVALVALDRRLAAACLGSSSHRAVRLWPSGLYGALAQGAVHSPFVWRRCRTVLDSVLGTIGQLFDERSAEEVYRYYSYTRGAVSSLELAAMLWSLLRRRDVACSPIIGLLATELKVLAVECPYSPRSSNEPRAATAVRCTDTTKLAS